MRRLTAKVACALAVSATAIATTAATADTGRTSTPADTASASPALGSQLAAQIGPGWWHGKDQIFTAAGDSHGMHYFAARESEGYYWRPLATILPTGTDASDWTEYFCVSADSRYILATVFPTPADNYPAQEDRGALAYVIDVATGSVRPLVAGVAMYYDVAGCGSGDTGVLSSFLNSGESRTDLVTVDLATARIARIQRVDGQVTSAVPASAGIDAYLAGSVVSIGPTATTTLATVSGVAYDLRATANGGLDYLSTTFGSNATAWYLPQPSRAPDATIRPPPS